MERQIQQNAEGGAETKVANQVELEKFMKLMQDTGEARCPKLIKRFTSIDN